jgi:hypothetical protein
MSIFLFGGMKMAGGSTTFIANIKALFDSSDVTTKVKNI